MDLVSIVTPVQVDVLKHYLIESNYDKKETEFLTDGFTNGFDIGYEGPTNRHDQAQNLPLKVGSLEDIWQKLMDEVKVNRF